MGYGLFNLLLIKFYILVQIIFQFNRILSFVKMCECMCKTHKRSFLHSKLFFSLIKFITEIETPQRFNLEVGEKRGINSVSCKYKLSGYNF